MIRNGLFGKAGLAVVALTASMMLLADYADARVGRGGSFGSRGTRTYTPPAATTTAPKPAAPIEKSMTQPGKSTSVQGAPGAASRFGGLRSLLLGGLIGAALASIFGLGALANILGFILQIALIGGVIWLVMNYLRNRRAQPAMAGARPAPRPEPQPAAHRNGAGLLGGAGSAPTIGADDYDAFERLLGEVQTAYGRNDLEALGDRATPEMLSYFAGELDQNRKDGVRNEVSEPKLMQGDLAEAWREDSGEYATVAMRYSITDVTVEAASGRVVAGSKTQPQEVAEVWTFRRPHNADARQWELSAIQQAA